MSSRTSKPSIAVGDEDVIEFVRRLLSGLEFGELVLDVRDGAIVRVARTEKIRLGKAGS